jgi:FdhD protein
MLTIRVDGSFERPSRRIGDAKRRGADAKVGSTAAATGRPGLLPSQDLRMNTIASTRSDPLAPNAAADGDRPPPAQRPRLTDARCAPTREIRIVDEHGEQRSIHIPAERPLTVFVDRRELVTLMTLGARPELLVLGYLLNQRLVEHAGDVESVSVDWDVSAAAVRTRAGVHDLAERTARRVVTTGCGQGTVFGDAMAQLAGVTLPDALGARIAQGTLQRLLATMREQDSIHRKAGSVHGCALFRGEEMLMFVEDVGRHNAIDTIAGWMAMRGEGGADKLFYTTGRLTSEMVMKAARMGVPIVVSRNGVTAMGHELASRLGMALFGRAANRRFLCYTGAERLDLEPETLRQPPPVRLVSE